MADDILLDRRPPYYEIGKFHTTIEGQRFLRELCPSLLARYGERKVATLVADTNAERQSLVEDSMRSAIRRWIHGQERLYKDEDTNTKIISRIEQEMMAVPEIAAILEKISFNSVKNAVGTSLARFVYGSMRKIKYDHAIIGFRNKFAGIFVEVIIKYDAKAYKKTGYPENNSNGTTEKTKNYYIFSQGGNRDFSVFHSYSLDHNDKIFNHSSGFAFPDWRGEVHCFCTDNTDPFTKNYIKLRYLGDHPSELTGVGEKEVLLFRKSAYNITTSIEEMSEEDELFRTMYGEGIDICLMRSNDEFITNISREIMWNIRV